MRDDVSKAVDEINLRDNNRNKKSLIENWLAEQLKSKEAHVSYGTITVQIIFKEGKITEVQFTDMATIR